MKAATLPRDEIKTYTMIRTGIVLAVGFWIVEACIHTFVFHDGGFVQEFLPVDPNELWMRSLVSCILLGFGIYAHTIMDKLRRSERERRVLQEELEESLTKMLSGFIPICAHCKDIRDKSGNWSQIEGYIQQHSELEFSHGICPKCLKVHYPKYAARN